MSLNMTCDLFSKRFKKVFGKTPYRWMLEGRGQNAYREITATKKVFKQIAADNGFNSDTQLTRYFKKEYGKTPSELRKEAKKAGIVGNGKEKA